MAAQCHLTGPCKLFLTFCGSERSKCLVDIDYIEPHCDEALEDLWRWSWNVDDAIKEIERRCLSCIYRN